MAFLTPENRGRIFPFLESLQFLTKNPVTLFGQIAFILVASDVRSCPNRYLHDREEHKFLFQAPTKQNLDHAIECFLRIRSDSWQQQQLAPTR
jgi:hypothetical protein